MSEIDPDHLIFGRNAQLAHSEGRYSDAKQLWNDATAAADDPLDKGRYIRGFAVSSYRSGDLNMAFGKAQDALDIHIGAMENSSDTPTKLELIESSRVLGRMTLHSALLEERDTGEQSVRTAEQISRGVGLFERALETSDSLPFGEAPQQHQINLYSDVVIARRFNPVPTSDVGETSSIARVARRIAWQSESPAVSGANLGRVHRAKAVGKALYRAYAASAVDILLRPETVSPSRRALALRIATLPGVL